MRHFSTRSSRRTPTRPFPSYILQRSVRPARSGARSTATLLAESTLAPMMLAALSLSWTTTPTRTSRGCSLPSVHLLCVPSLFGFCRRRRHRRLFLRRPWRSGHDPRSRPTLPHPPSLNSKAVPKTKHTTWTLTVIFSLFSFHWSTTDLARRTHAATGTRFFFRVLHTPEESFPFFFSFVVEQLVPQALSSSNLFRKRRRRATYSANVIELLRKLEVRTIRK